MRDHNSMPPVSPGTFAIDRLQHFQEHEIETDLSQSAERDARKFSQSVLFTQFHYVTYGGIWIVQSRMESGVRRAG